MLIRAVWRGIGAISADGHLGELDLIDGAMFESDVFRST
jgi:hypothetical protein